MPVNGLVDLEARVLPHVNKLVPRVVVEVAMDEMLVEYMATG